MSTVLDVEIFAVAVGVVGESGLGHVGHHVEIVTETDILYLPVTANILLLNLFVGYHGLTWKTPKMSLQSRPILAFFSKPKIKLAHFRYFLLPKECKWMVFEKKKLEQNPKPSQTISINLEGKFVLISHPCFAW